MKGRREAARRAADRPSGRIIIQLSELCGAELTRTGADFLLPILPSATSPCRGYMHTQDREWRGDGRRWEAGGLTQGRTDRKKEVE